MAFRFRLEKVLRYRQRLVDQKALELAEAGRRVAEIAEAVEKLELEIQRLQAGPSGGDAGLSVESRIQLTYWLEHLDQQRGAHVERMIQAQEEEALKRESMTRAWQDLDVLKKLKVRQKELWAVEILKQETRDLDELGVQRADRARREKLASV